MGGFFELELPELDLFPLRESPCCAYVSSGRAALELLLRELPQRPRRVWAPRFVCDSLLQPLARLGLATARYGVSEALEPLLPESAEEEDCLILVNYFGLTGARVVAAAANFPGSVLVDMTTALYAAPLPMVQGCFYSPRKFGGLSDGGVAVCPHPLSLPSETDRSAARAAFLLQRCEEGALRALPASEAAEAALNAPPRCMSLLTRRLIRSIDWVSAEEQRRRNYACLHAALAPLNRLPLPEVPDSAPFCYPLVTGIPDLRDSLIDAGVALPLFWPEVIAATEADSDENKLARTLLPLPLDQRYDAGDMQRLIELILG